VGWIMGLLRCERLAYYYAYVVGNVWGSAGEGRLLWNGENDKAMFLWFEVWGRFNGWIILGD
jgi:hypothetical protein